MSENLMFSDKLWWSQQDSEGHVLWYIDCAMKHGRSGFDRSDLTFELYGQGKENIKMSAWQALKKAH